MLALHPSTHPSRLVVAPPGVPESHARALDRRHCLHRQMESFRSPAQARSGGMARSLSGPGGPTRV